MQTNTVMAERLYAIAIEFAGAAAADDVVWDLYCGAGAIGLLAAGGAGSVYGIEISPESIAGARRNAERNGIANAKFLEGDVARSVRPLLERAPRPDVVFVDPPRSGLTPKAVRRVLELAPERLVYVSCNPTTLAPNARQLSTAATGWSGCGRWTCSRTRRTSSASRSCGEPRGTASNQGRSRRLRDRLAGQLTLSECANWP